MRPRHEFDDLPRLRQMERECACLNLRRAARAVTQLYDEALRPAGLLATQFPLLSVSARLGRPTVSQLAEVLVMDRTTLTRNLKPLERDGLLRTAPGRDRRVREVLLTKKGQKVLLAAYPFWRQAQARVARGLGRARMKHLIAGLTATVGTLRALER